jgi:hypothetical protein
MKLNLAVFLFFSTLAFAGSQQTYQPGKLVDLSSSRYSKLVSNTYTGSSTTVSRIDNLVSVQLDDLVYTGECIVKTRWSSCRPGELVIGDPVDVRLDKDHMYLKLPNGSEFKTKIVKRERVTNQ